MVHGVIKVEVYFGILFKIIPVINFANPKLDNQSIRDEEILISAYIFIKLSSVCIVKYAIKFQIESCQISDEILHHKYDQHMDPEVLNPIGHHVYFRLDNWISLKH
jgi:hypothetical protein